ncbi:MAG: hypothetical protein H0S84_00800 [Bacteroidales bacterium]|nr:hypothetical protein [Bacteroidales bacterium]
MTYDPSKKITVSYNPLNLPSLGFDLIQKNDQATQSVTQETFCNPPATGIL